MDESKMLLLDKDLSLPLLTGDKILTRHYVFVNRIAKFASFTTLFLKGQLHIITLWRREAKYCIRFTRFTLCKKEKCWLSAFSPVPTMFSKDFFLWVIKSRHCAVKGYLLINYYGLKCRVQHYFTYITVASAPIHAFPGYLFTSTSSTKVFPSHWLLSRLSVVSVVVR